MLKGGTKAVEVKNHFLPIPTIPNEALREFPTAFKSTSLILDPRYPENGACGTQLS